MKKAIAIFILFACTLAQADVTVPSSAEPRYSGIDFNRTAVYKLLDLYLADDSGNTMNLQAPSLADDTTVFTFPADNGTSGNVLTTDGSGNTSWDGTIEAESFTALDEGELKLREATGNGTNTTGFQAPADLAADVQYTMPDADGAAGQVLKTDGAKNLGWASTLTSPMDSDGDFIIGGVAGAPSKLDHPGSDNRVLRSTGAASSGFGQIDATGFFTTGAAAGSAAIGIITTAAQSFGGVKTFDAGLVSTGNLGIGGTPAFPLDIEIASAGQMMTGTLVGTERLRIYMTAGYTEVSAQTGNDLYLGSTSVGVGRNDPTAPFEVYSTADDITTTIIENSQATISAGDTLLKLFFSGDTNATGAEYVSFNDSNGQSGSITGQTSNTILYNTSSDIRKKENISDYVDGYKILKKLSPRNFTWKKDGTHDVGFIAQEVYAVYPHAVYKPDDPEKMYMMDYGKMTPLLASAIRTLIIENESMKAKVAAIELRLAAIENN